MRKVLIYFLVSLVGIAATFALDWKVTESEDQYCKNKVTSATVELSEEKFADVLTVIAPIVADSNSNDISRSYIKNEGYGIIIDKIEQTAKKKWMAKYAGTTYYVILYTPTEAIRYIPTISTSKAGKVATTVSNTTAAAATTTMIINAFTSQIPLINIIATAATFTTAAVDVGVNAGSKVTYEGLTVDFVEETLIPWLETIE
jgi:hypothetical protein